MGKEKPGKPGQISLVGLGVLEKYVTDDSCVPQEFQLMACCRLLGRTWGSEVGRAGLAGVQ